MDSILYSNDIIYMVHSILHIIYWIALLYIGLYYTCVVVRIRNIEEQTPSVNHHTTTQQYSIQHQPSSKNSSVDSTVKHEYFEIIVGKHFYLTQ